MSEPRRSLLKLLTESLLIVFSVLLALFGDVDYATASLLSRAYTSQEDLRATENRIFALLQPSSLTEEALPQAVALLAGNLYDLEA